MPIIYIIIMKTAQLPNDNDLSASLIPTCITKTIAVVQPQSTAYTGDPHSTQNFSDHSKKMKKASFEIGTDYLSAMLAALPKGSSSKTKYIPTTATSIK
jgi:hypothetical protein